MPEYNLPWVLQFLENQAAQLIEDEKYPEGHLLREITVTASGRPEDRMRANLQSSIERRLLKDARDRYTLLRNMNLAQEGVAHNFGMPLIMGAASPLGVAGWTAGSAAAHEAAKGNPTAEKIVSGAELGLMALGGLGAGYMGGRFLMNNTNLGRAYQLSRAIGRGKVRETPNFGNNELFRTTVYHGGPIRDPYQLWVTTDPKYAALYGKVRKYNFETKNPSYSSEPLMGSKDPVTMDMMIWQNIRNNPDASAIIGHDLVTGEFPYESQGLEILSLDPYQFSGFRLKPKYVYHWQLPNRSTLTTAERAGIPKGERNFKSKWHVAAYPGYLLSSLMKGSPLEKQLSKLGTISINSLNAHFNKATAVEREIANKVLAEKFTGQKTIDYNLFKKAVLDELINYSIKPQMQYSTYGMNRLGFNVVKESDGVGGIVEYLPEVRTNTFTFESPKIPVGNAKHYDTTTLGHSRTYTTLDEPNILHVMESLSDWGQSHVKMMPSVLARQIAIEHALRSGNTNAFHGFTNRLGSLLADNLTKYERMALENINKEIESGLPSGFSTIEDLWNKKYEILKKAGNRSNIGVLGLHLHDNYLQRQLQENLRYAAENGLTKMRYPTPETAAKIEGYTKTEYTPEYLIALDELNRLAVPDGDLAPVPDEINLFNDETIYYTPEKRAQLLREAENRVAELEIAQKDRIYPPLHQTILKKYADFPKLFLKLFKDLQVRTVTDARGNTWYEVDVPKGYLSREWRYKYGGRLPKWFKNIK